MEEVKLKRYDHIPVRPSTFEQFRSLKTHRSDNAFVLELINLYRRKLEFLKKKQEVQNV